MQHISDIIRRLEGVIHVDPGNRGISNITLDGELLAAAKSFVAAKSVRDPSAALRWYDSNFTSPDNLSGVSFINRIHACCRLLF